MIKNNRILIWVLLLFIIVGGNKTTFGQDPIFTQFYANPMYLNPAFAGSRVCPRVALNYRNEWPNISGNFVTTAADYGQKGGVYFGIKDNCFTDNTKTIKSAHIIYTNSNISNNYPQFA